MEQIQVLLEWAGTKSLTMPDRNRGPGSFRSFWPDYPDDPNTAYGYTGERVRVGSPSAPEITVMDAVLRLPLLIQDKNWRRIVNLRSLTHPLTGRYLYPFGRIRKMTGMHINVLQHWHNAGLEVIALRCDWGKVHTYLLQLETYAAGLEKALAPTDAGL